MVEHRDEELAPGVRGGQAISRAMRIVRFLGFRMPLGGQVREIARECDLPLATVHRLLQCLLDEGMVLREHPPSRLYKLGPMALGLGTDGSRHHFDLMAVSVRPCLETLATSFSCTAELVVRVGRYGVCADRVDAGSTDMTDVIYPGESALLGFGAVSIALLAALPGSAADEILWDNRWTNRRAGIHLQTLDGLIERARSLGYAYSDQAFLPGVRCVAMCIPCRRDFPSAAIGLYFEASALERGSIDAVVAELASKIAVAEQAFT